MTPQRLLNIITVTAIVATFAALVIWQQNGEAPPSWLSRVAAFSWIAALILAIVGERTRPRLMLRFLSALFALFAIITLIADWSAPAVNGSSQSSVTLLDYLTDLTPSVIASIESTITRMLGVIAWDPILRTALNLPAWLFFTVLAGLAGYAGRPRRDIRIFVN